MAIMTVIVWLAVAWMLGGLVFCLALAKAASRPVLWNFPETISGKPLPEDLHDEEVFTNIQSAAQPPLEAAGEVDHPAVA
jgi:hypothetical protein